MLPVLLEGTLLLVTVAGFKGGVGKTTSAVHIACYFAKKGETLLVDGDPNRSATGWNKRGNLPFKVVDLVQAALYSPKYEHIVIDTRLCIAMEKFWSLRLRCLQAKASGDYFDWTLDGLNCPILACKWDSQY
jgi:hypothetical protein